MNEIEIVIFVMGLVVGILIGAGLSTYFREKKLEGRKTK